MRFFQFRIKTGKVELTISPFTSFEAAIKGFCSISGAPENAIISIERINEIV